MILSKNGEKISLNNENHISAFLSNGWAEAKASVPPAKAEKAEEVKVEPKATKRKQEK